MDPKTLDASLPLSPVASPFAKAAPRLHKNDYSPLPIAFGTKAPCSEHGQLMTGWTRLCDIPFSVEEISKLLRRPGLGVGVATGYRGLIAVDHDYEDLEIGAAVANILDLSIVEKHGRRGRTSFYRDPTGAIRNRKFICRDGQVILEILAKGCQTVLPPTVHPETGKPYVWLTARTLENTKLHELPVVSPDIIARLEEALAPWLPERRFIGLHASCGEPRTTALSEPTRQRHRRYALTILDRECCDLAAMAPNSGRNAKVYHVTCRLGRWMHHGIIASDELAGRIVQACEHNGLIEDDGRSSVLATINSGLRRSAGDCLPGLAGGAG
jgi:Bifunctional DNA primase/polymerase, N-terminal